MSIILADSYDGLVSQAADIQKSSERSQLRAYWTLGDLVVAFQLQKKSGFFPNQTIETLAGDLQARGAMAGVGNPTRYLYWAKTFHERYKADKIDQFAEQGVTLTHVKLLSRQDDRTAEEVQAKLFREDGKIVSTREAKELVLKAERGQMVKNVEASKEAAAGFNQSPEERLEAPEGQELTGSQQVDLAGGAFTPETDFGDQFNPPRGAQPEAPGNAPLETPRPTGKPKGADKPKKDQGPEVSPFKPLKAIDGALEKVLANSGDIYLALASVSQRGWDSAAAENNFNKLVGQTLEGIRTALKLLPEIEQALMAVQSGAAPKEVEVLPPEKATKPKGKRKP